MTKQTTWKALAGKPFTGRTVKAAAATHRRAPARNWLEAILTGGTTWETSMGKPTALGAQRGADPAGATVTCPECLHEFAAGAA